MRKQNKLPHWTWCSTYFTLHGIIFLSTTRLRKRFCKDNPWMLNHRSDSSDFCWPAWNVSQLIHTGHTVPAVFAELYWGWWKNRESWFSFRGGNETIAQCRLRNSTPGGQGVWQILTMRLSLGIYLGQTLTTWFQLALTNTRHPHPHLQ